jgi:hypothetical protein
MPQQGETMRDWVVKDTNLNHQATVFSIKILLCDWSDSWRRTDRYTQL